MGNRLSKIVTKTGDKGTTGLGDGSRVAKNSARVNAYGDVDELNCLIGVLISELTRDHHFQNMLLSIQHDLFDLGGELCIPGHQIITMEKVDELEVIVEDLNDELPPLKNFILPGGTKPSAYCNHARAVCRRVERQLITLAETEQVFEPAKIYLNRLSDLLFICGRVLAREGGGKEVLWQRDRGEK